MGTDIRYACPHGAKTHKITYLFGSNGNIAERTERGCYRCMDKLAGLLLIEGWRRVEVQTTTREERIEADPFYGVNGSEA